MNIKLRPSDRAFSQYIRMRDRACQRCGSAVKFNSQGLPVSHQASHFQGRGKEATRFDPENVDTLCGGCHQYLTANPYEHVAWQIKKKGKRAVDAIVLRSNGYKKRDDKMEVLIWRQAIKDLTSSN
ncbi:recombination protein NinG [Candidatus Saccharibacteria bacterium]|nr:recombination protein NinG [Candidatus Saccharibacteria bacterium]